VSGWGGVPRGGHPQRSRVGPTEQCAGGFDAPPAHHRSHARSHKHARQCRNATLIGASANIVTATLLGELVGLVLTRRCLRSKCN
jgi:hypothetical protein